MVKLLFLVILILSLLSCDEEMTPVLDCKTENYFSRFEKEIYDNDTSNSRYMENIIRLRYDRTFSHLVGKDCFPNRPDVRCVSGDFYIYNLLSDTISFIFWYTKKDGFRISEDIKMLPLDSLVILNDPSICDRNSPGFKFFYWEFVKFYYTRELYARVIELRLTMKKIGKSLPILKKEKSK
jgi:hypothetical protein